MKTTNSENSHGTDDVYAKLWRVLGELDARTSAHDACIKQLKSTQEQLDHMKNLYDAERVFHQKVTDALGDERAAHAKTRARLDSITNGTLSNLKSEIIKIKKMFDEREETIRDSSAALKQRGIEVEYLKTKVSGLQSKIESERSAHAKTRARLDNITSGTFIANINCKKYRIENDDGDTISEGDIAIDGEWDFQPVPSAVKFAGAQAVEIQKSLSDIKMDLIRKIIEE